MSTIKNIYTFGTSFTKGGGFEFWSYDGTKLKRAYKDLEPEFEQWYFSWPGQLKKVIDDDNINVVNLAESGYGNERIYRKVYDIVNSPDFDVDTDVFLFEFSHLGRKEFFSRIMNKPIIMNYSLIFDNVDSKFTHNECNGYAYRYWEHTDGWEKINDRKIEYDEFFQKYLDDYCHVDNATRELANNITLFLYYLSQKNVKFWFMQPPLSVDTRYFDKIKWDSRIINFSPQSHGFMLDFILFSFNGSATIKSETKGYLKDGHTGYIGNKLIAYKVFNHLVELGLLNKPKKVIDYDYMKKLSNKILDNIKPFIDKI